MKLKVTEPAFCLCLGDILKHCVCLALILTIVIWKGDLPGRTGCFRTELPLFQWERNQVRHQLLRQRLPVHLVCAGETLSELGRKYFVSAGFMAKINHLVADDPIAVGEKLFIPPANPAHRLLRKYRVLPGQSVKELLCKFDLADWELKRLNPSLPKSGLVAGMTLTVPGYRQISSRSRSGIVLVRPVWGVMTSGYGARWGRMHTGIDWAAPKGTPVTAAASGKVVYCGWRGGYGLLVIINHGNYVTHYAHLSTAWVAAGDWVRAGQRVGNVGATGRATGNHLHFECEVANRKVNPYRYLIQ